MPAHNERFGAMAGVVIIQAVLFRTTVSGSLNGVQLSRWTLCASRTVRCEHDREIDKFKNREI